MSGKKRTIKRMVVPIPQNLDEAAKWIAEIGQTQRTINGIQNSLNGEIEQLKTKALIDIEPLERKISQLADGLFIFAESRRPELTEGEKRKTVQLPTGIFGWRLTPPKVVLRNVKQILEILSQMGLTRFIRVKNEINKEALSKEPKVAGAIKGVSVSQCEEFFVKPAEVELEIARRTKLKKSAS